MNAQQLKNAILQEAIEGRLVPQDPNDEPASILLERIRAVKEKLVKAGKLKKKDLEEKPISEDEIPFEIPDSWEWVKLGDVSEIARGGSPRPIKEYLTEAPNGLNWIKIGDTDKGGKYINSCKEKIKTEGLKKTRMVHPGDFLLTNSMSYGRPYITNIEGCIHDGWLMISPYSGTFDQSFLYHVLSSAFAYKQFSGKVAGAVVQNLNSDKVADSYVPLPPLAEQKRIVAKIEELLPKVEKYGKAQEELNKLNEELPERLKKSILQEAIEGRLVPQDPNDEPAFVLLEKIREEKKQLVKAGKLKKKDLEETPISEEEIPFEIPDSWEWYRLFDCVEILYGYPFDSTLFNEMGHGFPLIRIRDIIPSTTKTYTTEHADDRYIIRKGDMLVGMDGNFNVRFWQSDNAYLNQRVCKIKAKDIILDQKFLYYYLPYALEEVFENVSYVTVKHLSDKHFRMMLLPIPPLAEQKRIVAKIEQLLGEIDKLKM